MGKLYTLDKKLLTETPEVRVGETIYPIDNRKKTVYKLNGLKQEDGNTEGYEKQVFELLLGKKAAKEVDELNLPFPAHLKLIELIIAAATGEEPEVISARFQKEVASAAGTSL